MDLRSFAVIGLASSAIFFTACEGRKSSPTASSGGDDAESYALGYKYGENAKKDGYKLNPATFAEAMKDAMDGKSPRLSQEEIAKQMQKLYDRRTAEIARTVKENEDKEKAFLEKNRAQGFKETATGLQYKAIVNGSGPQPKLSSRVLIKYTASLPDGSEFESTKGVPVEISMAQLIPGFREALLLMKKGSRWTVAMPSRLAYGNSGRAGVPPGSATLFDVELVDVK